MSFRVKERLAYALLALSACGCSGQQMAPKASLKSEKSDQTIPKKLAKPVPIPEESTKEVIAKTDEQLVIEVFAEKRINQLDKDWLLKQIKFVNEERKKENDKAKQESRKPIEITMLIEPLIEYLEHAQIQTRILVAKELMPPGQVEHLKQAAGYRTLENYDPSPGTRRYYIDVSHLFKNLITELDSKFFDVAKKARLQGYIQEIISEGPKRTKKELKQQEEELRKQFLESRRVII